MNRAVPRLGRALALLLAATGIAAILEARRSMPLGTADDPGPGLLPLVLGLAVAVLGVAAALARTWPAGGAVERGRLLAVAVAMVGWAVALPYLGFAVTTVAGLFVLGRGIGGVPITRLLVFALLVGGAAALLFGRVLQMSLPRGPWGW